MTLSTVFARSPLATLSLPLGAAESRRLRPGVGSAHVPRVIAALAAIAVAFYAPELAAAVALRRWLSGGHGGGHIRLPTLTERAGVFGENGDGEEGREEWWGRRRGERDVDVASGEHLLERSGDGGSDTSSNAKRLSL